MLADNSQKPNHKKRVKSLFEQLGGTYTKKMVSHPKFKITCPKGTVDRNMGTVASGLSEAVSQGYINQSSHKR